VKQRSTRVEESRGAVEQRSTRAVESRGAVEERSTRAEESKGSEERNVHSGSLPFQAIEAIGHQR
jgi:hypothetical protein